MPLPYGGWGIINQTSDCSCVLQVMPHIVTDCPLIKFDGNFCLYTLLVSTPTACKAYDEKMVAFRHDG